MNDPVVKIFTVAHVPQSLSQAWLQHLRDFDLAHPGCHFEVMADSPGIPLKDMVEMVKVDPALSFTEIIERGVRWEPAVHVLHHGLPLCRFTPLAPSEWPKGHKWVGLDERTDATCPRCAAVALKAVMDYGT